VDWHQWFLRLVDTDLDLSLLAPAVIRRVSGFIALILGTSAGLKENCVSGQHRKRPPGPMFRGSMKGATLS